MDQRTVGGLMTKVHDIYDEKLVQRPDGGLYPINIVCRNCGQTWPDGKAYVNSDHNTSCKCGPDGCKQ